MSGPPKGDNLSCGSSVAHGHPKALRRHRHNEPKTADKRSKPAIQPLNSGHRRKPRAVAARTFG